MECDINAVAAKSFTWKEVITLKGTLLDRKYDLLRMRWQLLNRHTNADPKIIPAAVWWIDQEVMEINMALEG